VQAAATAAVNSATLADTGVDLVVPLGGGVVALLLGTVLFALLRRRRAA
jgi:LPXTG-motif cell wall-anchored protein